jgi:phosphoserine phosphatase RsbU/P
VVEHLTLGGLPLGIRDQGSYESGTVALRPGDWLLVFTDGLVEALNQRGQEYGDERLVQMLRPGGSTPPDELLRRVMTDVDAFVGETPQHDDITCMFVKVNG